MNNEKYTIALYRIAREGQSTGHVVGLGRTPKQWDKNQIIELADRINGGPEAPGPGYVPVYLGHDPNNKVDRKQIGQTLAAFSSFIFGAQEAFAVIIINDPWTVAKIDNNLFNIASIEANLTLEAQTEDDWKVVEVEKVTGIVLGSDDTHTPGFKSARLISTVHEMDESEKPEAEDCRLKTPAFPANIDGGGVHWPQNKLPKLLCVLYFEFYTPRQCRNAREEQPHELEECTRCSWRAR